MATLADNDYAMCSREGLDAISAHLARLRPDQVDALRGRLCVAVQRDVEVTEDLKWTGATRVAGVLFCAAHRLHECAGASVAIVRHGRPRSTMWVAASDAQRNASDILLLALLGRGAFGNESNWIFDAIRRSFGVVSSFNIDARIVSCGAPSCEIVDLAGEFR